MALVDPIEIQSSRINLKPFTSNDAEECYSCITPSLTRYMSWDPPRSSRFRADMASMVKHNQSGF